MAFLNGDLRLTIQELTRHIGEYTLRIVQDDHVGRLAAAGLRTA